MIAKAVIVLTRRKPRVTSRERVTFGSERYRFKCLTQRIETNQLIIFLREETIFESKSFRSAKLRW